MNVVEVLYAGEDAVEVGSWVSTRVLCRRCQRGGLDVAGDVIGDGVEVVRAVDRAGEAEALGRVGGVVGPGQAVASDARGVGIQLDLEQARREPSLSGSLAV